eukprot:209975-Chlamydomonas_euryale.AAC.3
MSEEHRVGSIGCGAVDVKHWVWNNVWGAIPAVALDAASEACACCEEYNEEYCEECRMDVFGSLHGRRDAADGRCGPHLLWLLLHRLWGQLVCHHLGGSCGLVHDALVHLVYKCEAQQV